MDAKLKQENEHNQLLKQHYHCSRQLPSLPSLPSAPSLPSTPSAPSLPSTPSVPSLPPVPSVPHALHASSSPSSSSSSPPSDPRHACARSRQQTWSDYKLVRKGIKSDANAARRDANVLKKEAKFLAKEARHEAKYQAKQLKNEIRQTTKEALKGLKQSFREFEAKHSQDLDQPNHSCRGRGRDHGCSRGSRHSSRNSYPPAGACPSTQSVAVVRRSSARQLNDQPPLPVRLATLGPRMAAKAIERSLSRFNGGTSDGYLYPVEVVAPQPQTTTPAPASVLVTPAPAPLPAPVQRPTNPPTMPMPHPFRNQQQEGSKPIGAQDPLLVCSMAGMSLNNNSNAVYRPVSGSSASTSSSSPLNRLATPTAPPSSPSRSTPWTAMPSAPIMMATPRPDLERETEYAVGGDNRSRAGAAVTVEEEDDLALSAPPPSYEESLSRY